MVHARKGQQHPIESSRQLQRKLYLAAKKSRNRRFHALYDRIYRPDVLWRAWEEVKANKGSAGIDGVSLADVESEGVNAFIQELHWCLKEGKYRPQPVRRVYIPKADGSRRPLGVPTVRDRVVQQACRIVIEPLFEANFQDCSYGFRPKRSATEAVERVKKAMVVGWHVVDADIRGFFDHLDQELLVQLLRRRISDRRVLKLLQGWLTAGVLEEGKWEATEEGTPQGGVVSPLLANIYLHVLDMYWMRDYSHLGKLYRYCDDFVIVCNTRRNAASAYRAVQDILSCLRLELHPDKTRVVDLNEAGFDFLGFHLLKMKSRRSGKWSPYMWPSDKSMKAIRRKIHEKTDVRWLCLSPDFVIQEMAPVIRGWSNYFRRGNATERLQKLDRYVQSRLWRFFWKKHQRRNRRIRIQFSRWYKSAEVERFYLSGYCGQTL